MLNYIPRTLQQYVGLVIDSISSAEGHVDKAKDIGGNQRTIIGYGYALDRNDSQALLRKGIGLPREANYLNCRTGDLDAWQLKRRTGEWSTYQDTQTFLWRCLVHSGCSRTILSPRRYSRES